MTVCTTEIRAGIGFSETQSARQQVVRYRLEERFSNFQKVNGLTLPGTWNIHFTIDGYQSAVLEWKIRLRNAEDNVGIDPATYSLK